MQDLRRLNSPTNAADFDEVADVVTNNGEPFAVKVYLSSEEALDVAIELIRRGLDER